MESPLVMFAVHWDHEPRLSRARRKAPINRTHSRRFARFGDARQSRSVWSACVFSAAFPRQAARRWPGRFIESRLGLGTVLLSHFLRDGLTSTKSGLKLLFG